MILLIIIGDVVHQFIGHCIIPLDPWVKFLSKLVLCLLNKRSAIVKTGRFAYVIEHLLTLITIWFTFSVYVIGCVYNSVY